MDVSSIASTATNLAMQKNSDAVNVIMLKKALDTQAVVAKGLLDALPQPMPANPNIGRNINTTA